MAHRTATEQSRPGGRVNQKERTRSAIIAAAHQLAETGEEVTMPAIAAAARVSEATAYRYFPDLVSLLRVTMDSADLLDVQTITQTDDPVERVGQAADILGRAVLRRQGAVRAMIAGTITKPTESRTTRPALRLDLIEHALAPWIAAHPARRGDAEQLTRDLAVVISAESLFTLTDLCGLSSDDAITSLVHTARNVTAAAVGPILESQMRATDIE